MISRLFVVAILTLTTLSTAQAAEKPCAGVDRSLSKARKIRLAPVIAKQLGDTTLNVLQSFRYSGWSIIYIDDGKADQAFLFYSKDPATQHYTTTWGGAAGMNEGSDIRTWVLTNAPGIPRKLATCFAWHVTRDRDQ